MICGVQLLRWRPITKTVSLDLPDGSTRKIKVTQNDMGTTQHVEDGDQLHGTGRVISLAIKVRQPSPQRRGVLLRNLGMPKMRQAFARRDGYEGLWAPVAGTEELR